MNHSALRILAIFSLAISVACAGRNKAGGIEPMAPLPLAGLVAQPLIILPAHYLRTGDSIQWTSLIPESRAYLAAFDSALERIFKARGVPDIWKFAPELARSSQRNVGYIANPYQLAAQGLRPPTKASANQLTDPLASQIRAMTALHQARVALIPVEIRFEGRRDSAQAVVRVALLDALMGKMSWAADIRSDVGTSPRGVLESLARHVANLALPP